MTLLKHHIHKYNHFARIKGHGIVSNLVSQFGSPYVWDAMGNGVVHHQHHHYYHDNQVKLLTEQSGSGTVAHKHEMSGGEIHVRNGRHHRENKLHKQVKSLSIKPLKFKI